MICIVRLHRRDVAVGTLASVLRQSEMDGDSFIQALGALPRHENLLFPGYRHPLRRQRGQLQWAWG